MFRSDKEIDNWWSIIYDCENRLGFVSTGSGFFSYSYDLLGRRIRRLDLLYSEFVEYVWDGEHIIAEYDSEGSLIRKYIYGPGIDNPVVMINADGGNETRYYYYTDALGSVRLMSNSSGQIVEGYSYDPFGRPTVNTTAGTDCDWLTPDGSTASASAIGNTYMFTARQWDSATGIYYYRFRDYHPALGRFLQPDPAGYIDGMNLYAYVGNNSINFRDPWGLNIRKVGHGWGNWHRSIQVDNPEGGYSDYTYHMNDNERGWWQQTIGQFWWGGKEAGRNGIVDRDGWGDGNAMEEITTTPEQDRQFKEFLDNQLGDTGPYGPPWGYNCHDWTEQIFDIAESNYGKGKES